MQKAKSDQLYNIAFEIIDEIANIDLFGVIDDEKKANSYNENHPFKLMFGDTVLTAPSARRLFIGFAEAIVENKRYEQIAKGMVIKGCPTFSLLFGNELGSYNGQSNSVQSRKTIIKGKTLCEKK